MTYSVLASVASWLAKPCTETGSALEEQTCRENDDS